MTQGMDYLSDKEGRELQKAARALRENTRLARRSWIEVPGWLYMDAEDTMEAHREAIAPFWDAAACEVRAGRYRDLVLMLERLEDQRENHVEPHLKEQQQKRDGYRLILRVLKAEASFYGADKTIGASLGDSSTQREREFYAWSGIQVGDAGWVGDDDEEVVVEMETTYYLTPADSLLQAYNVEELPHHPVSFEEDVTWREAWEAKHKLFEMNDGLYKDYLRLKALVRFRMDTIRAVLREYELCGYVALTEEREGESEGFEFRDPHVLAIIRRGLELLDEAPEEYGNRSSLTDQLAIEFEFQEGKHVQDYLAKYDLYVKQEGRGRPSSEEGARLLEETIERWREVVNSVNSAK